MKTNMEAWEKAEAAVKEMPAGMKLEFAQSMNKVVSEKDILMENIEQTIADLRESWAEFPKKWTLDHLVDQDKVECHLRHKLGMLKDLERTERREEAREEAERILRGGTSFDSIVISGFGFGSDGIMAVDIDNETPF